jgi:hypothetical protein
MRSGYEPLKLIYHTEHYQEPINYNYNSLANNLSIIIAHRALSGTKKTTIITV